MSPNRMLLLILPLTLLGRSQANAQLPVQPQSSEQTQPASTTLPSNSVPPGQIRLHVVVTDKSGRPITDLAQTSFVLSDNGHPLPVLSFEPPAAHGVPTPTSTRVVLVIDAVNAGINTIDYERDQVEHFLRSNGGHLPVPVSIVIFTDTDARIQNAATQDGNALADDLHKQSIGLRELRRSAGFWGATERYDLSVRTLRQLLAVEATRPGHKVVLWISPGWPYLSGPGVDLSNKQEAGLFRSLIDTTREFQQAQVTLYSIDPLGLNDAGGLHNIYYESFLKGVTKPSQVEPADLSLQVLATHSGGHVAFSNNDITKEIANDVAEASASYTITAQIPPADQPDIYHDLQLKVEAPGLTARTTTGYYTRP